MEKARGFKSDLVVYSTGEIGRLLGGGGNLYN